MNKITKTDETAIAGSDMLATDFYIGAENKASIGFQCKICQGTQTLPIAYHRAETLFPICDECLSDLREFVKERRK